MAAIRGRNNKSTELALIKIFRKNGITGWRRKNLKLPGTPDFVFPKVMAIVFVDGCFWHGCSRCGTRPQSNKNFWLKKITDNKKRDRRVNRQLLQLGWKVIRFWEHQLTDPILVLKRTQSVLRKN